MTEQPPHVYSAIAAVMAMAKLHGLLVDKKHVTGNHQHHHSVEPVSESALWVERLLGDGSDREAPEPLTH